MAAFVSTTGTCRARHRLGHEVAHHRARIAQAPQLLQRSTKLGEWLPQLIQLGP